MVMKTLITVDLDYWTNCFKHTNQRGVTLLKEIKKSSSKSLMIWQHHHILDVIPRGIQRVINIDFHNDIIGEDLTNDIEDDPSVLNEGTWGNFLPPSVEAFDWYYPSHKRCVTNAEGLCGYGDDVPEDYQLPYTANFGINALDFKDAALFVLCVSPQWATTHSFQDYLDVMNINAEEEHEVTKF